MAASAVGYLLHDLERSDSVRANAAQLAVDVGCLHLELCEGRSGCRIFRGPIEPGSGQQPHVAIVDPRRHPVAVEFDFVNPLRSGRGGGGQLRKLGLNPTGKGH